MAILAISMGDMPALLFIPSKLSEPVTWSKALLQYIETAYAEDSAKYEHDAQALDRLRQSCLAHPPSLSALDRLFT